MLGDLISSTLPSTKTDLCVLLDLKNCSRERIFGILCTYHAKQIFAILLSREVLNTHNNTIYMTRLCMTQWRTTFLPFPFSFKRKATGELDLDAPLCFDRSLAEEKVHYYVSQISANKFNMENNTQNYQKVVDAILALLMDGTVVFPSVPHVSTVFQLYLNEYTTSFLHRRWENVDVTLHYKHGENNAVTLYPMQKMPKLYQILLMYAEVSNNIQVNNSGGIVEMIQLQPNIILDVDAHAFVVTNVNEQNPMCLLTDSSTYASSLILSGEAKYNKKIALFRKFIPTNTKTIDNLPRLC